MLEYWDALKNALIDRTPAELIGAIVAALLLSLAATGLYHLGRTKVRDGVMLMTGLVLFACVAAMLLTIGVLERDRAGSRARAAARRFRPPPPPAGRPNGPLERHLARQILKAADRDGDGTLSEDEAADAAAQYIRDAKQNGAGAFDIDALAHAIRTEVPPPSPPYWQYPPPVPSREPRGARNARRSKWTGRPPTMRGPAAREALRDRL